MSWVMLLLSVTRCSLSRCAFIHDLLNMFRSLCCPPLFYLFSICLYAANLTVVPKVFSYYLYIFVLYSYALGSNCSRRMRYVYVQIIRWH
ncbi:hypothetical protein DFH29DRAFT_886450 [Suillus ampliporus]|nr:hypothetical protein DFH29DRAFT_886450 [Suillus ampliporus]